MNPTELFAFESDFVDTLRCVPMAVRFKLDACGIKLSLRQWSGFTLEDRHALRLLPCDGVEEVGAYRGALEALIRARAGEQPKPLSAAPCDLWRVSDGPAQPVLEFARSIGVRPPSALDWSRLSPLQRFVLLKLSRDNHDNVNFVPAMREFGLLRQVSQERVMALETAAR